MTIFKILECFTSVQADMLCKLETKKGVLFSAYQVALVSDIYTCNVYLSCNMPFPHLSVSATQT